MKPLEGLTILDLSRVLACPFASMILAELGARVIKVEQPGSGDETRTFEPQLARDSAYYFACNRSKESITVNLRSDDGRKLIRELAEKADVLVENFPVGTLGRYGLDFASLSALNPRLIYVSCTGFGQTGPYREKKGYDTVFQAMGGIMSLTGERGGGPVKPGLPVADLTSGLWVAIAILASLAGREKTGKGCQVDFSALTRADLIAKLDELEVPIGPVNDVAEILGDPHVRARQLVGSFDYPGVGEFKALAVPYKFLGWDNPQVGRPPTLGEHTAAVLAELGYSRERIAELRDKRAI